MTGIHNLSRSILPTELKWDQNMEYFRRMFNLNTAFDRLRKFVPTFAYEKSLSRIETLRLAISYIHFMNELIASPENLVRIKYGNAAQEIQKKWSTTV